MRRFRSWGWGGRGTRRDTQQNKENKNTKTKQTNQKNPACHVMKNREVFIFTCQQKIGSRYVPVMENGNCILIPHF